ncbi:hypothetical protein JYU34_020964 [Plutella xylostella]|uniref:Cubilin n=1 Tax=Plutella xylostella TaxID=51655 RepID=A0ABQ7PSL4_PLUXY|nr:hypothetical protein JYU34_020964 [Plutella xylostella]
MHQPLERSLPTTKDKPTKMKTQRFSVRFITSIIILAALPYSKSLSLPSGDPAPGRSPGPPEIDPYDLSDKDVLISVNTDRSVDYEETTSSSVVTELSTVSEVSGGAGGDACAYARAGEVVVTLGVKESDINLSLSHSVFETEELVRGVVYEVNLEMDDTTLRDYVLYSTVDSYIRGNFTPTDFAERPCRDQDQPHFVPKHARPQKRNKNQPWPPREESHSKFKSDSSKYSSDYRTDYDYRTGGVDSDYSELTGYYFRPRVSGKRSVRASGRVRSRKSLRMRRIFSPARIVSGVLGDRTRVVLLWSVSDSLHVEAEATVVFRLRYRKTTSATIYQVFFTKILRLECALRLRSTRAGRVHSGQLPRARGCRLLPPPPAPPHALLLELHKLNVPCAAGFVRFAPNTPQLCGKWEQIPAPNRKFIYYAESKNSAVELHGRPMFAATYRLVDHCHDVQLTNRNGSFEIGPTDRLFCSYTIHLPYGSRVALRLQMGTGPMINKEVTTKPIHEDHQILCKGMSLVLEDGDSKWRHCSQQGDPLRSVQIVSEGNLVRLNISVLVKRGVGSSMWLKVWWMEKAVDELVGRCEYGWVSLGDFCVAAFREAKRAWRQAEAECVRLGGHLVSIMNERQQHTLDQLLIHTPGAGVDDVYWVGATDALHEGEFRWSNGLSFSYAHWYPGWRKHSSQPNDDGMSGQDCVEARREFPPRPAPAAPTFMWNDRGCREHNYYVCERPSYPNDDGMSGQDCVEARREFPPRPAPAAPTFMWNDRGCREHNYYVCEKPSVDDPYSSTILQCNETIQLSRSHAHATVSSPGFPRAYPDDVSCASDVRAPPGHTLLLHFEELLTEYEPHCSYDYLEIEEIGSVNATDEGWPAELRHRDHYSVENEVWEDPEYLLPESDSISAGWARNITDLPSRRLCGDWSGKLKLLRYQSTTNGVRLRFRADHSRHFAGYRARVTMPHAQSCADAKQVLFRGHCYLFTSHPRASWATAKQVCEGLNMHLTSVHSAEEERFVSSGIRQSSDYSAASVYWLGALLAAQSADSFLWVDGSAATYQGWPPYNDTEEVADATDEQKCLGVQWKSSPVPSQPSGLYWVAHKCTTTGGYVCKRRLTSEHIVTNQTVEGSSGTLTSPNYPAVYDNDLDYWVHVRGPLGTRLVFSFDKLDLEPQRDCLYDYVELRDSADGRSQRYCGSVAAARWVATSNRAVLHFHSDYNTQSLGFSLTWKAVSMSGCPSQTFTSKEGVVSSPNYPDFLLPGLDCTFDILAPAGKRVFLNISHFDFGYGSFENGVPVNVTEVTNEESILEIQIDLQSGLIRPFRNTNILTNGLFISESEILRIRLKTGENSTGKGFLAHFKSVSYLNTTHVIDLHSARSGQLAPLNWPAPAPRQTTLHTLVVAPHHYTLSAAFARTKLVKSGGEWPCGERNGWIEVKDSYTDHNGTQWTLCDVDRTRRKVEQGAPLVINSYLHSLIVTQHSGELGVDMDVTIIVNKDPGYHNKLLLLSEDTNLESCYPNPCQHGGRCINDATKNFCSCRSFYTGVFCLLTACDRAPCALGNCSLTSTRFGAEGFECACPTGWKGRRCNEKIRPCASRPCNNRGACLEKDGGFLCQCNPSWVGKRCEAPNPTPRIVSLGTRMLQEPFWLGLIAVFVVLGIIGLVWCGKRHFPEKIEKLLAEEADRCARRKFKHI